MDRYGAGARTWRVGLNVAAIAAIGLVLWRAAEVVRLIAVALVLAAALESPVSALVRRGWRRGAAIALACALSLAVVGAVIAILVPRVVSQVQQAIAATPDLLSDVQRSAPYRWLRDSALLERAVGEARTYAGAAVGSVVSAALGVLSFVSALLSVAALTVFLLVSGPSAWAWLLRWIPPARRGRVRRLGHAARGAVAGYVAGALSMCAIEGCVMGILSGLLGIPWALALAAVTATLAVVPFVGAVIAAALLTGAALVTRGPPVAVIALAAFLGYLQLEAMVLQPLVQRRATTLNPLVVLCAVLLGSSAAGVFGGVLALPAAAAAKVVANDVLARRRRGWRRERGVPRESPPAAQGDEPPRARQRRPPPWQPGSP